MTATPELVIGWLLVAHLLADFVLQPSAMAVGKRRSGLRGWAALTAHAFVVGLCLVPVAAAFGAAGLAFLVLTVLSHPLIDRMKVILMRRVMRDHAAHAGEGESSVADGPTWGAAPAALFLLDQALHIVVLLLGWAALLAAAPVTPAFAGLVDGLLGAADRATVHQVAVTAVTLGALAIVNVPAASVFVTTLVRPRVAPRPPLDPAAAEPPVAYTLRAGRFTGRIEPDPRPAPPPPVSSQARVGEAIGVLERLLLVALVLLGEVAAIGFVVAAKTLARFKQLDEREFAEYYLLGTLASVTVALLSGAIAASVLSRVAAP